MKSTEGSVGDPIVSQLYGKLSSGEHGLLVTLGTLLLRRPHLFEAGIILRLIDGEELVDLIFHHYEQFDSRYKGALPLKRIYVAESVEDMD